EEWLAIYEKAEATEIVKPEVQLHVRCWKARGEFVGRLRQMLIEAGAGKDSSPGSAGWMLERLEADEWGTSTKLEVTGQGGGPLIVEGRAAVGWADLFAIAQANGYDHLLGLAVGSDRQALPAAREVLPDSAEPERSADAPSGVPGS
ncbi:MAG: hypothetical protein ACRD1X_05155, partial [Vicinamibacteria bacterium]